MLLIIWLKMHDSLGQDFVNNSEDSWQLKIITPLLNTERYFVLCKSTYMCISLLNYETHIYTDWT